MYLFHELPAPVRRAVAAEMARVLRPGGLVVLVDSVQARAHAVSFSFLTLTGLVYILRPCGPLQQRAGCAC